MASAVCSGVDSSQRWRGAVEQGTTAARRRVAWRTVELEQLAALAQISVAQIHGGDGGPARGEALDVGDEGGSRGGVVGGRSPFGRRIRRRERHSSGAEHVVDERGAGTGDPRPQPGSGSVDAMTGGTVTLVDRHDRRRRIHPRSGCAGQQEDSRGCGDRNRAEPAPEALDRPSVTVGRPYHGDGSARERRSLAGWSDRVRPAPAPASVPDRQPSPFPTCPPAGRGMRTSPDSSARCRSPAVAGRDRDDRIEVALSATRPDDRALARLLACPNASSQRHPGHPRLEPHGPRHRLDDVAGDHRRRGGGARSSPDSSR